MDLKYFSLNDDKESLKKKWKSLAIKFHPDKNMGKEIECTKKMQEINAELEYCIKYGSGFDIETYDAKNPNDFAELIKMFMFEMIDDVFNSNSNKSIMDFYAKAKNIIQNGISQSPIIKVIQKDDINPNKPK